MVHKRLEGRCREVPYFTCLHRPSLTTRKSSIRRLHIIGYSWCIMIILGSVLILFLGLFFLVCLPLHFQGRVSVGSHDCPETGSLDQVGPKLRGLPTSAPLALSTRIKHMHHHGPDVDLFLMLYILWVEKTNMQRRMSLSAGKVHKDLVEKPEKLP